VRIDNSGTQLNHETSSNLHDRLSSVLDFANNGDQFIPDKAINTYFKLLHVHPFSDGNGRLSRAVVQSLLKRTGGLKIHPCLFRFQCPPKIYFDSVKSSSKRDFNHHQEAFYIEATKWAEFTSMTAFQICDSTLKKMHAKIGLYNLNNEEKALLDTLWESPILSAKNMEVKIKKATIRLMEFNILKAQRLSFSNHTIFVCDDILDCWDNLDNLLIKH